MSSPLSQEDAAELVSEALAEVSGKGLRPAGKLLGVSHDHVGTWRRWLEEGGDPAQLPMPTPDTVQSLRDYLAIARDVEDRRRALKIAAARLEDVAAELRSEANEADAGILAAARAHGYTKNPRGGKRRKGGG